MMINNYKNIKIRRNRTKINKFNKGKQKNKLNSLNPIINMKKTKKNIIKSNKYILFLYSINPPAYKMKKLRPSNLQTLTKKVKHFKPTTSSKYFFIHYKLYEIFLTTKSIKATNAYFSPLIAGVRNQKPVLRVAPIIKTLRQSLFLISQFSKVKYSILFIENEASSNMYVDLASTYQQRCISFSEKRNGMVSNQASHSFWSSNNKKPSLIVCFHDTEDTFVREAYKQKIPTIFFCNLDHTIKNATYVIPCNINSYKNASLIKNIIYSLFI